MSGYEGGMHLLYGVSLLCQVAILWVLSRRTSEYSVKAKFSLAPPPLSQAAQKGMPISSGIMRQNSRVKPVT